MRGALLVERQACCCGAPKGLRLLDDRPAFIRKWISADFGDLYFIPAPQIFRGQKRLIPVN